MPSSPERPDFWLEYLENLYALAQVLTPDTEQAATLVTETLRQGVTAPDALPPEARKAWLFRRMLRLHAARNTTSPAPGAAAAPAMPLDALRRRLAGRIVEHRLPAAFLTLPHTRQLLVVLCDVEGLSPPHAAALLDMDASRAADELAEAHAALLDVLRDGESDLERRLFDSLPDAPDTWLPPALQQALKAALSPLPPSLRPAFSATLNPAAPPAPPRPAGNLWPTLRRVVVTLLLIITTGLLGYGLSTLTPVPRIDNNLITRSADAADALQPTFRTASPEQAERYVRSRLNWRLTVPTIQDALLLGVGFRTFAPGLEVPVFLYEDHVSGTTIAVHTYTYALLERHPNRMQLNRDILLQIETDRHFDLHDLGRQQVLVWRHQDDIFVAVTAGDAETLRSRIQFPS